MGSSVALVGLQKVRSTTKLKGTLITVWLLGY